MSDAPPVAPLVDDLFRRSAGEITAVLLRRAGGSAAGTVEEAVQEAFVEALRTWPVRGVPDNPRGWLYRVAQRRMLDAEGKRRRRSELLADAARGVARGDPHRFTVAADLPDPDTVADDELALLLLCCDPALPRVSQMMLTLKVGCGFSVREIAAAFLARPSTVAQRCVRAKRFLRDRGLRPPEPTAGLLRERAPVVREVLYLLFCGGHAAAEGEAPIRAELCSEAIRLGRLMLAHDGGDEPATRALVALMCLHAARLPARVDGDGLPVLLEHQDRDRWDRALLAEGFHHLEESARGDEETPYHLEAAIAAVHAAAPSVDETDWDRIVELYDDLLALRPSPVVALNRAIAVAAARGAAAGLEAVEAVADDPALERYHLLPATLGTLRERMGQPELAAEEYRAALALASSAADRAQLRRKLEGLW